MMKFEEGKKYYCRSICDHGCIFTIEVVKRTAKTVTYIYDGQQRRSNIKLDDNGNEYIKPDNYSMAPVFRAERQQEEPELEATVEEVAQAIVEGVGEDIAAGLVEYANLVKDLANDLTYDQVKDTTAIKELLSADLPNWDEEDWEDLRAAVEKEQAHSLEGRRESMITGNLPKFKEVRTISWDSVRNLCIAKEWYTRGDNEAYSELAGYVSDMEEATTEALAIIANDIYEHSNTAYCVEAIMWELNRASNTLFIRA